MEEPVDPNQWRYNLIAGTALILIGLWVIDGTIWTNDFLARSEGGFARTNILIFLYSIGGRWFVIIVMLVSALLLLYRGITIIRDALHFRKEILDGKLPENDQP